VRLVLATALLAGCTVLHEEIGRPIPWEPSSFEEGETHYRAVMKELGAPLRVSRCGDGVAFLYEHLFVKEGQVGISYDGEELGLNIRWLQWLKFTYGKAAADRQALVMTFDVDGILQAERFLDWDQKLGTGFSVEFLVDVGSVVDTSAVRKGVNPNRWGAMVLRPLPQTLNADQSIDDGRFGLEQRGTPRLAGQRTLEMRRNPRASIIPILGD